MALDIVVRHFAGVLPDWLVDFAGMKRSRRCCRFIAGLEGWCSCALVLGLLLGASSPRTSLRQMSLAWSSRTSPDLMLQGRGGAHIVGFCGGVRVFGPWSGFWSGNFEVRRSCTFQPWLRRAGTSAQTWCLSCASTCLVVFSWGLPMSNYMFKPTAELTFRTNHRCRRGGLTWR